MSLDKLNVTLYDLLGYLLPGFVLLLACSVAEATFGTTHILALSRVAANPIPSTIAAYFLGHICHGIGSGLQESFRIARYSPSSTSSSLLGRGKRWLLDALSTTATSLDTPIFDRVLAVACETYGLTPEDIEAKKKLNVYTLSDNYLVVAGGIFEREVLQSREGFYKASSAAFALFWLVCTSAFFFGGLRIQMQSGSYELCSPLGSFILSIVALAIALLLWKRFVFFNSLKKNNTLLMFLALRAREKQEAGQTMS